MRKLILYLASVGMFALLPHSDSHAAIVTSFEGAMQPGSPAAGWEYLWNRNGPIGNPANYVALLPTTNPYIYYDADGVPGLPGAGDPAAFVYLGILVPILSQSPVPGGHPAHGTTQAGTGGIERFAIAAYTLPSTGIVSIVGSQLLNADNSLDGLHVQVYLGSQNLPLIDATTSAGLGSSVSFNGSLGFRTAGEKVYVGIGARGDDFFDTFRLRYSIAIEPVPEPASCTIFGALISLMLFTTCRSRWALRRLRPFRA